MNAKLLIFSLGVAGLMLSSCTKKVKVEVAEIEGPLAGAFSVATGEYEVTKDSNGNPCIVVDITRTQESVPYSDDAVSVIGQETKEVFTAAAFGYTTLKTDGQKDENVEPSADVSPVDEQLQILKLKSGQQGKLTISLKEGVPSSLKLTSDLKIVNTGEIALEGAIGQYGIKNFTIDLDVEDKTLKGKYQYLTSPAGAFLYLNGKLLSDEIQNDVYSFKVDIQESSNHSSWSGTFDATLSLQRENKTSPYFYTLSGSFLSHNGKTYQYNLKSAPLK